MGDKGLMRAAILATQLGFSIACPLVALIAGGVWADGRLGTRPWLFFLGLVLGLLAAAAAFYQVALAQPARRADSKANDAPDKIELGTGELGSGSPGKKRRER
jgi:F0F1-type ATP synthase assembly protein I